ncbi:terpenoid synthase [Marasmius fiardii PR-910]|nr:terpenoid synthase [Marasmius fiardii PR-910]
MTRIKSLEIVDASSRPSFFGSFEVRNCWNEVGPSIQAALLHVIHKCTEPGSRERRKALYMHDNPAGNLFSLSFGLCESERLGFLVQHLSFLCIIDDVLEDHPHEEALIAHKILGNALRDGTSLPTNSPNIHINWVVFLHDFKSQMLGIDPVRTPALLQKLADDIDARESRSEEFKNLEEYLPAISQLMLWAMNIDLSPEEHKSDDLARIKYSTGVISVLANDFFSWEREKQQQNGSDRIRNGVVVLIKQCNISEMEAKEKIKKIIIEEELKVKLLLNSPQSRFSTGLKRYLDGLQMFASGYNFWCATCPRYNRPHGDSD